MTTCNPHAKAARDAHHPTGLLFYRQLASDQGALAGYWNYHKLGETMTDTPPSTITGSDATARLIAVYEQLGHSRQDATRLAIDLLGAYGREYQREYRPIVLREVEEKIRERAGELSDLAEEEMRRDLEERAQEWHEAANIAERMAKDAEVTA